MTVTVEQRLDSIERTVAVTVEIVKRIEARVIETNGRLRDVEAQGLRRDGALSMLRWIVVTGIAAFGVSAPIAGIVLGFIAKGG